MCHVGAAGYYVRFNLANISTDPRLELLSDVTGVGIAMVGVSTNYAQSFSCVWPCAAALRAELVNGGFQSLLLLFEWILLFSARPDIDHRAASTLCFINQEKRVRVVQLLDF